MDLNANFILFLKKMQMIDEIYLEGMQLSFLEMTFYKKRTAAACIKAKYGK